MQHTWHRDRLVSGTAFSLLLAHVRLLAGDSYYSLLSSTTEFLNTDPPNPYLGVDGLDMDLVLAHLAL